MTVVEALTEQLREALQRVQELTVERDQAKTERDQAVATLKDAEKTFTRLRETFELIAASQMSKEELDAVKVGPVNLSKFLN